MAQIVFGIHNYKKVDDSYFEYNSINQRFTLHLKKIN